MRKLIAITHVSVDGVMQGPGGTEEDSSNGFTDGGWAMAYGDDLATKILTDTIAGDYDLVLGRRTYDIFASYWPNHGDNPIGKKFNAAKKYVATRTLKNLYWQNSQTLGDDAVEGLQRLKTTGGPDLHLWGSSHLLQTLTAAEVVDEYRLWLYPIVLGKGKRLFENGLPKRGLTLVKSQSSPSGILFNTYRLAPKTGA